MTTDQYPRATDFVALPAIKIHLWSIPKPRVGSAALRTASNCAPAICSQVVSRCHPRVPDYSHSHSPPAPGAAAFGWPWGPCSIVLAVWQHSINKFRSSLCLEEWPGGLHAAGQRCTVGREGCAAAGIMVGELSEISAFPASWLSLCFWNKSSRLQTGGRPCHSAITDAWSQIEPAQYSRNGLTATVAH